MAGAADSRGGRADPQRRPGQGLPGQRGRPLVHVGVPDRSACSTALAVVAAVLVWQWRGHRGPVMVGRPGRRSVWPLAAVAAGSGALGARLRYGDHRPGGGTGVRTGSGALRRGSARRVLRPLAAADRSRRCCFPLRSRHWCTCCPPRRPRGTISVPGRRSSTRCCLLVELGLLVKPRRGSGRTRRPVITFARDHAERQHAPVG